MQQDILFYYNLHTSERDNLSTRKPSVNCPHLRQPRLTKTVSTITKLLPQKLILQKMQMTFNINLPFSYTLTSQSKFHEVIVKLKYSVTIVTVL